MPFPAQTQEPGTSWRPGCAPAPITAATSAAPNISQTFAGCCCPAGLIDESVRASPRTAFRILSVYRSSATGTEPRERGARSHRILCVEDRYQPLREATAAALLGGAASTDPALRQAVAAGTPPDDLRTLVGKIRTRAYTVTDEDVNALRSRYSEDQLFEIVVSAAFGAARERLAAARRALEEA